MEIVMNLDAQRKELERQIAIMEGFPLGVKAKVVGAGMNAAAKVIQREAKQSAAFADDTGRLRASIKVRQQVGYLEGKRVKGAAAQVRAGGKGARQAWLVEYGHLGRGDSFVPAHPYFEPAVMGTFSAQLTAAAQAMRKRFELLAKRLARGDNSAAIRRIVSQ